MPKPKYIKELKEYYMNKSKKSTKYGGGDGDEDTFDGDEFDSIMKYILHKLNDKIKTGQGVGQGTTGGFGKREASNNALRTSRKWKEHRKENYVKQIENRRQ